MLRSLGKTGLEIAPLVFGGNVLGWTIDEKTSFQVLDAFLDHGFNAIDTADVYSAWASGNKGGLRELCIKLDLGVVTYYSLASGFLSGKYRSKADLGKSTRGEGTAKYLDERGLNILKALDKVSARHQAKPAEIALAWLMAREGVTAPIASATSVTQVESFARAANLTLTPDDVAELDTASF